MRKWLKAVNEGKKDIHAAIREELERRIIIKLKWDLRKKLRTPSGIIGIKMADGINTNGR